MDFYCVNCLTGFAFFALEWYNKESEVPKVDDIKKALKMTEAQLDAPENAKQKKLVIWYYDRWLPVVAGKQFWGDDIRYYHFPTDKIQITGNTPASSGQKVLVTVASEAFGLLVLENCEVRFGNIWEYFTQNHWHLPVLAAVFYPKFDRANGRK